MDLAPASSLVKSGRQTYWRPRPAIVRVLSARPYDELRVEREPDLVAIRDGLRETQIAVRIDSRGPADKHTVMSSCRSADLDLLHIDAAAEHTELKGPVLLLERSVDGLRESVPLSDVFDQVGQRQEGDPIVVCVSGCSTLTKSYISAILKSLKANCEGKLAAVIGFNEKTKTEVTAPFWRRFYSELGAGATVEESFTLAATELKTKPTSLGLPEPMLLTLMPDWRLFAREFQTVGELETVADVTQDIRIREIPDPLVFMRMQLAPALHRILSGADPGEPIVQVVGPIDSGRAILVRGVMQRVSWRFSSEMFERHDPREGPVTARWVARRIVAAVDGAPRVRVGISFERRAEEILTGEKPVLLAIALDDPTQLTEEARWLLTATTSPSIIILVSSTRIENLPSRVVQIEPLNENDSRSYFKSQVPKAPGWTDVIDAAEHSSTAIHDRVGGHLTALQITAAQMTRASEVELLAQGPREAAPTWTDYLMAALALDPLAARVVRAVGTFFDPVPSRLLASMGPDAEAKARKLSDAGFLIRSERISERSEDVYAVHRAVSHVVDETLGGSDPAAEFLILASSREDAAKASWVEPWRRAVQGWAKRIQLQDVDPLRERGLEIPVVRLLSDSFPMRQPPHTLNEIPEWVARSEDYLPSVGRDVPVGPWGLTPWRQLDAVARALDAGRLTEADTRLELLADDGLRDEVAARIEVLLAYTAWRRGSGAAKATKRITQALPLLDDHADKEVAADALTRLAEIHRERGKLNDASRLLEQASLRLDDSGSPDVLARLGDNLQDLGSALVAMGERNDAERLARLARSNLGDLALRDVHLHARVAVVEAEVAHADREFARADETLREAHGRASVHRASMLEVEIDFAWGRMLSRQGDSRGAHIRLERAVGKLATLDIGGPRRVRAEVELARLDAAVGDARNARRRLDQCQTRFHGEFAPPEQALLQRADAQVNASLAASKHIQDPVGHLLKASALFVSSAFAYSRLDHRWRAAVCHLDAARCFESLAERTGRYDFFAEARSSLAHAAGEFATMSLNAMRAVAEGRLANLR